MIGGGYAMISGEFRWAAVLASIPYGLGVMSILTGKHIDQMAFDSGKGIRTLPVLIGERAARRVIVVGLVAMYGVVAALVVFGAVTPFAAAVLVALPRASRALRIVNRPRPAGPPPGYVGWPLWYHRVCLVHNRLFGWAYIGALAAGALWRLALH
jgi:1,4-dihydroxy-2-naphthoate polyprenyltransferase